MPINDANNLTNVSSKYGVNMFFTMLAPIFWGTTYLFTTEFLPADLPFYAAAIRVLPAGIILLFVVRQLPKSGQWGRVFILSFLNISCFQALLFIAAYRLPGGIAAVIGAIQPLVIMALLWKINHISPKPITILATISTIVGMSLLLVTPNTSWDKVGLSAAFFGAVSMGCGIYLTKRWKPDVSNITFTCWQLLFGGIMLLPLAILLETFPSTLTVRHIIGYAYLAIFGSLIAYTLWFRGIRRLPSVAVSILGSLSPITATIVGWLLLDERLSLLQAIGFMIALVSVFIVQYTSKDNHL